MRVGSLFLVAVATAGSVALAETTTTTTVPTSTSSPSGPALTCPFQVQSSVVSTLETPIVAPSTSGSTSGSGDGTSKKTKKPTSGSTGGDSPSVGDSGSGSAAGATTKPPTNSTTKPTKTTATPVRTTTTKPTSGSTAGVVSANVTTHRGIGRFLVTDAGSTAGAVTTSPVGTDGSAGVEKNNTKNSTTAPTTPTTTTTVAFTCDEAFYNQWDANKITCGGAKLDVKAAVAATQCVIYSGAIGDVEGSSCMSICAFPACTNGAWNYGASNGLSSEVYANTTLKAFMTGIPRSSDTDVLFEGNGTMSSPQQCSYNNASSAASFSACTCSALASNSPQAIKKSIANDKANGIIPKDKTTTAGSVIAPTSQSLAGVTILMSSVAAVASTTMTQSVAAIGANAAIVTIEVCQFSVTLNQLKLDGKSSALAQFGKSMAFSTFTFLPFGKMEKSSSSKKSRRLLEVNNKANRASDSGIAQYSRTLGIREDMLFLVTLTGIVVVMGGILGAFALAYLVAGAFMDREVFMTKFYNKMIGVEVLVAVLAQYTLGVTGTYQIYYSFSNNTPTDMKCILAFVALFGMAIGIMVYGFVVVNKYDTDIKDVGTAEHLKKAVCQRYGPLYEEYNYKNRYFFAAKMMVALVTGVATGFVGLSSKVQVIILLVAQLIFFFYLEAKSPHHSKFAQTTTSFVTIMKIATLALTFFLVTATAGLPTPLQNGFSLAIVGLNMVVLFLLMLRSMYGFWKKYQMQRDAKQDDEDRSAAQEFFKDETPVGQKGDQQQEFYGNGRAQQGAYDQQQYEYQPQKQDPYAQQGQQYQQQQYGQQYDQQYQQPDPRYQQQQQQQPSQRQVGVQRQAPSQRQMAQQPSARSRYQQDVSPTMQADNDQIHLQSSNLHQSRVTNNMYADVPVDPSMEQRYGLQRPESSRQYVANPNDRYHLQANDVIEL